MVAKEKIEKGRVFVQTTKGIVPYHILQKAQEDVGNSQQLQATQKWMTLNDLVPPPYDPMSFLNLYESNSVFYRCVGQLAIDIAGLGWSLQLRDDKKDSTSEHGRITELLENINPDEPFRKILEKLLIDWGIIGYFGLEVARNRKQDIAEIYHVPAHTLRVHKDRDKYCQIRNNKKAWFKKFGITQNISTKTGKDISGNSRDAANELIFYKNYYPKSDYYGAPNILSAVGDIMGLIGLRDYNLAFFENYGVPAALIVLEGDWDVGSDKKISEFLNTELKGSENAHRTLVVTQPDKCKFHYEKLGVEVKESSFKLYEKTRQEDILIAYSMPPQRIGVQVVGKLGGNMAEEATKIYVQSVVEPLQLDIESIINNLLIQSEIYRFKFNDIDTRDKDALSDRLVKEIGVGLKNPNEGRNELGLKPYPEGDKFFMQSSLIPIGEAEEVNKFCIEPKVISD